MLRPNRQDLIRRAEALLERRSARSLPPSRNRWWTDQAKAELKAFKDGGPLPTSTEALELLAVEIELDELV